MSFTPTDTLTSWGRVLRGPHRVARPHWRDEVAPLVAAGRAAAGRVLPIGLGRSYGDSALNPDGAVIATAGLSRFIAFDPASGILRADAGTSLDEIIRLALPHGWFLPVLPGTKFVTLGGAIANDIHGKNHHGAGTFGRHVRRLALRRSDGALHELAPDEASGLFAATVAGLGLTGVIEWAELQLAAVDGAWLDSEDVAFDNLDGFFRLAEESAASHPYTVAWVDCTAGGARLGRGIFSRARPAANRDRTLHAAPKLSVPIDAPSWALNPLTLKAFNTAYNGLKRLGAGRRQVHYDSFFFPLDAIGGWNRLYGPAGFYQHQCVVPPESARDAVAELLAQISRSGQGSFLAVLKTFGNLPSPGLLSFPREGATLALDFRNQGAATLDLLDRLDAVVREAGGRLYPAKDGRISREMFAAGYPNLDRFAAQVDPAFSSAFWRRVAP